MFIPEPGPDLIVIEADKVEREGPIVMSDQEKENEKKKQNRGKIFAIGEDVKFWREGDWVSFYKDAATPIKEGGKEYLSIHKGHVLCRFIEKEV